MNDTSLDIPRRLNDAPRMFWWEIDVSYYLLKLLSWCGIVWDLKPVPAQIYEEAGIRPQSTGASEH